MVNEKDKPGMSISSVSYLWHDYLINFSGQEVKIYLCTDADALMRQPTELDTAQCPDPLEYFYTFHLHTLIG